MRSKPLAVVCTLAVATLACMTTLPTAPPQAVEPKNGAASVSLPVSPSATISPTSAPSQYRVSTPLTVRVAPCITGDPLRHLEVGAVVSVTDERRVCVGGETWVRLEPGGWVNARYLEVVE